MKFAIFKKEHKLNITCYTKTTSTPYIEIYLDFDKQFPQHKNDRKVNFRKSSIGGKFGACISNQFDVLLETKP